MKEIRAAYYDGVWDRIRIFVKAILLLLEQQRSHCHGPSGRM